MLEKFLLSPLNRLYNWVIDYASDPRAMTWLAVVAFLESSVFPIPQEVMMIPMIVAARQKAFHIAGIATLASVAGGILGYGIGAFFQNQLGQPILAFYGAQEQFLYFQDWYSKWGIWVVAIGAFTPLPYKVTTIASGIAGMNILKFTAVSFLGRGARFFLLAGLLWYFGPWIKKWLEARFGLISALILAIMLIGFVGLKFYLENV